MKAFREAMSWIIPILIGLIITLVIKQFFFQIVRVDGPSMQPNLQNNERGDTVSSKNGNIYVNGKKINQDYISKSQRTTGTGNWTLRSISVQNSWLKNNGATKVPKGEYFVLGDHRSVSNDGRYWGFVPKSKIDGVVKIPSWTGTKTTRENVNKEWQHFYDK